MSLLEQFSVTMKSASHSYYPMQAKPEKITTHTPVNNKEVRTKRESCKHLFITIPSAKTVESKPDALLIDTLSLIMILEESLWYVFINLQLEIMYKKGSLGLKKEEIWAVSAGSTSAQVPRGQHRVGWGYFNRDLFNRSVRRVNRFESNFFPGYFRFYFFRTVGA